LCIESQLGGKPLASKGSGINQLTDGGIPLSCDSMHSLYISTWKPCFKRIKRLRTTIEGQVRNDHGGLDRDLEGARSLGAASGH
jgi:hypothetical protein